MMLPNLLLAFVFISISNFLISSDIGSRFDLNSTGAIITWDNGAKFDVLANESGGEIVQQTFPYADDKQQGLILLWRDSKFKKCKLGSVKFGQGDVKFEAGLLDLMNSPIVQSGIGIIFCDTQRGYCLKDKDGISEIEELNKLMLNNDIMSLSWNADDTLIVMCALKPIFMRQPNANIGEADGLVSCYLMKFDKRILSVSRVYPPEGFFLYGRPIISDNQKVLLTLRNVRQEGDFLGFFDGGINRDKSDTKVILKGLRKEDFEKISGQRFYHKERFSGTVSLDVLVKKISFFD